MLGTPELLRLGSFACPSCQTDELTGLIPCHGSDAKLAIAGGLHGHRLMPVDLLQRSTEQLTRLWPLVTGQPEDLRHGNYMQLPTQKATSLPDVKL